MGSCPATHLAGLRGRRVQGRGRCRVDGGGHPLYSAPIPLLPLEGALGIGSRETTTIAPILEGGSHHEATYARTLVLGSPSSRLSGPQPLCPGCQQHSETQPSQMPSTSMGRGWQPPPTSSPRWH